MKKMINYAHLFLDELCTRDKILVDFTLGNGHDSAYFFPKVKQLIALDIQQIALDHALQNYPTLKDATLICDSHEHVANYVTNFDLGMFNLGYLPSGDKSITTLPYSTLAALKQAIFLLNPNGRIVVVVYIGHDQGKIESEVILNYVSNLDKVKVSKFELINRSSAPYIIIIDK